MSLPNKIRILFTESSNILRFSLYAIQKDLEGLLLQGLHCLIVIEDHPLYLIEDQRGYLGTVSVAVQGRLSCSGQTFLSSKQPDFYAVFRTILHDKIAILPRKKS